jgi:hypothetical protein
MILGLENLHRLAAAWSQPQPDRLRTIYIPGFFLQVIGICCNVGGVTEYLGNKFSFGQKI